MRLHPKKVDRGKLIQKCRITRVPSLELLHSYIWQRMMHCVFLAIEIAFSGVHFKVDHFRMRLNEMLAHNLLKNNSPSTLYSILAQKH